MFRTIGKFSAALVLFLLTAWFLYQIVLLAFYILEGAGTLQPTVYVPLSVTVLTAALGLGATLYAQTANRKREIEAAHRKRKTEIYYQFLNTLKQVWLSNKPELGGVVGSHTELAAELLDMRTQAVLWASPSVLNPLSQLTKVDEADPLRTMNVLDELQRAMRDDIGLPNIGLEDGFFTFLILNAEGERELRDAISKGVWPHRD